MAPSSLHAGDVHTRNMFVFESVARRRAVSPPLANDEETKLHMSVSTRGPAVEVGEVRLPRECFEPAKLRVLCRRTQTIYCGSVTETTYAM